MIAALEARFAGQAIRSRMALAALCGAGIGVGQPPFGAFWAMFLAGPLLILIVDTAETPRRAAWIGWAAGAGYFALTLSWIVEPFLVDIARHGWMAPFALVFLAGGLALFWAAAFWLAERWFSGVGHVLALAAFLSLAELARGSVLTGFPWALAAYAWTETPLMQMAAWIGPYGLTALTFLAIFLPARRALGAGLALLILGSGWWLGTERLARIEVAETGKTVRIVQPNAAQHLKWQPEMIPVFFERQLAATAAPGAPDIVVWPEVAVPFLYGERPDLVAAITEAAGGAHVIYGLRHIDAAGGWFNSMAVARDGVDLSRSDKVHLVPFGEYMPFADLFARFGVFGLAAEDLAGYSPGPELAAVSVPGLPAFLPLICYEAIFPLEVSRGRGDAEWMVHATNDAWFGEWTGPYQHLAQARFRAVEQGLPVARSANTGVSAMIDPLGRITASLPLGVDGHIDAALAGPLPRTHYADYGLLPFVGLVSVFAALALVLRRRGAG
ncbi:MAG: apolipoprotein N-acyltransferase [Pseudomonadota bacterium]